MNTNSEMCKRLGCDHPLDRHPERTSRVLARMAKGRCQWMDATSRPCSDCTCAGYSAKLVDRRGLSPDYARYDPEARCTPRTTE